MPVIIAVIVGALVGASTGGIFAILLGGVAGWLVARSLVQQRELQALRKSFDAVIAASPLAAGRAVSPLPEPTARFAAQTPFAADATGSAAAAAAAAFDSTGLPVDDAAQAARSELPAEPAFDAATQPAAAAQPSAAPLGPPPLPAFDLLGPIRRWLFGGNTIVKAGVGILFIGLAFLAKYASEHAHVPVEYRLAGIGGVALALLVVGWRLRLRRAGYAQVLQGGAVAALYLTLFVAFKYYGVLAAAPVFAMMVAVALLAAALAVLQDARALAVIGAIGGFATPLLVSTGTGNYIALFGYYLVLDLGIAAVAWHRTWRSLNLVGFFGTFVIGTAWGVTAYRPENFASSEAFLLAFFVLFIAIMLMPARGLRAASADPSKSAPRIDSWVNSSLLFGLPTVVFALQYGLVRNTEYAFYVLLASWMRRRPQLGLTFDAAIAIGSVFLTLVIPFALDARSTAGAWTLEGAGLVWIGFRQPRGIARAFGYLLLVLAGGSMLVAHDRYGVPDRVFNAYLFNGLMGAAASLAAGYFVRRFGDRVLRRRGENAAEPLAIALASAWLVSTAVTQISAFVPAWYLVAATLTAGSAIVALYTLLSARLGWRMIGWPTILHAPFLLLTLAGGIFVVESPLRYGGWWAWPLAFAVHLAVLRWVAPGWPAPAAHAVHAAGALVVAWFGALEGRALSADLSADLGDDLASAWPWLGWLVVPAALLLWLPRPSALRRWPMRAAPLAYAGTASAIIAAGLLLWTLVANVLSDGSAAPLPHVPLVNPLDIGIGIALLAIALWLRGANAALPLLPRPRPAAALLGVAAFVWLNAMLVRAFHHYGGVAYRFDAWAGSLAVQTGITLLWTATALALMWTAARRAGRVAWIAGAALLAAVVLKLLLIDLSGSGTVTRIVSFIGVGVLMLVIGYVAPLPTKETQRASA